MHQRRSFPRSSYKWSSIFELAVTSSVEHALLHITTQYKIHMTQGSKKNILLAYICSKPKETEAGLPLLDFSSKKSINN